MMRKGFTLIEVMVSVLIITLVIGALIEMRGNSSHILQNIKKQINTSSFSSYFIRNENYGFESKTTTSDKLLSDFNLDRTLRKNLKKVKINIDYKKIDSIVTGENMNFEIGKTIFKINNTSNSLIRLRLQ